MYRWSALKLCVTAPVRMRTTRRIDSAEVQRISNGSPMRIEGGQARIWGRGTFAMAYHGS